ncbi:MAG: hypothetical protein Q9201_001729 [Fulgogasparrea decipioides]
MTPQFYARYVPPTTGATPAPDIDHLEESHPSKKQRKANDSKVKKKAALTSVNINEISVRGKSKASSNLQETNANTSRFKSQLAEPGEDQQTRNETQGSASPRHSKTADSSLEEDVPFDDHANHEDYSLIEGEALVPDEPSTTIVKNKVKKARKADKSRTVTRGDTASRFESRPTAQDAESLRHVKVFSKYERSIKAAPTAVKDVHNVFDSQEQAKRSPETHGLVPLPQPSQVPDAAPPAASSALPAWLKDPISVSASNTTSFDKLSLKSSAIDLLKAKGYGEAFAIQAAVLPLLLPGALQHSGDLCIAASTGSGKTLAYALPMIEALRDKPVMRLRGLVVVPTRELVTQARESLEMCSSNSGVKIGTAFGSKTLREEQEGLVSREQRYDPAAYQQEHSKIVDEDEELLNWVDDQFDPRPSSMANLVGYVNDYHSRVDILVCTPGRLIEHLQYTRGFTLDHVQWLIIDEADRLMDENFQQWVDTVIPALEHQKPPDDLDRLVMEKFHLLRERNVRKVILSATMTRDVSKLQDLKLRRPRLVVLKNDRELDSHDPEVERSLAELSPGERVELPPRLQEFAVQIKDEQNKPLYLIELLTELQSARPKRSSQQAQKMTDGTDDSVTEDTSDSDSVSSNLSSSLWSSSRSTSLPPPESDSETSQVGREFNYSAQKTRGTLIFAHSTSSAHRLSRLLSILSPQQASTTAVLTKASAKSSKRVLLQFREGMLTTIISTDRASRGLDIPNLAQVINYDMPPSINSYVHRVGRTARAGMAGTATTLVGWTEGRWFWNEIGRGVRIQRGGKKITRKTVKAESWTAEQLSEYADALRKLGEETRGE